MMEYIKMNLPAMNSFASDYFNGSVNKNFTEYDWKNESHVKDRVDWLEGRTYPRDEMASYIESFMSKYGISEQVKANIDALREDALVIVGGQQAGLMTGPLYSIHKIISIIKLAKEQSERLNKRVVPIFWIAGEDHDFQEVNHVYAEEGHELKKIIYPEKPLSKKMISDISMDSGTAKEWVQDVFSLWGETEHTTELLNWAEKAIDKSETITDFFAILINDLFKMHGLLMVDSGDPDFRKLAGPVYQQIAYEAEISKAVIEQQNLLRENGYNPIIELDEQCTNLFYYEPTTLNRLLLEREEGSNDLIGKGSGIKLSQIELDRLLSKHPEYFSTNVVSRPLLQEKLFPVLGFIAGPGEIAYWSEIKPAFDMLGEKMPPIWPRLSFTLLEGNVKRLLEELNLSLEKVLRKGCSEDKELYLKELRKQAPDTYSSIIKNLESEHLTWQQKAVDFDKGLEPLFEKNRHLIKEQLLFMQKKVESHLERKNEETIAKYNRVENSLHPTGGLQERILNPFYFFNQYGTLWVDYLLAESVEFDGSHYVVSI